MSGADDPVFYLELYRSCFVIALSAALAAFALAVFLFIRLDIRGIVRRRSGLLRRKAVRKVRQRGLETGRLAANELLEMTNGKGKGEANGTGKEEKNEDLEHED